ncbi:uncharacterized protein LOC110009069 [Jatropha curcas]|uniref:uncharacterized protein LOC110009069 n=1 Tax=Jatropha curcas TaxID=180498 RepID=UPI0018936C13|nr:uncharacterized protein LOC110009069 [Jatropha curcas]
MDCLDNTPASNDHHSLTNALVCAYSSVNSAFPKGQSKVAAAMGHHVIISRHHSVISSSIISNSIHFGHSLTTGQDGAIDGVFQFPRLPKNGVLNVNDDLTDTEGGSQENIQGAASKRSI